MWNLLEDDLMIAIKIVIEFAKNTPDINEVKVMSDITECRAKQKLWSWEIIWKAASNIQSSPKVQAQPTLCFLLCIILKSMNLRTQN